MGLHLNEAVINWLVNFQLPLFYSSKPHLSWLFIWRIFIILYIHLPQEDLSIIFFHLDLILQYLVVFWYLLFNNYTAFLFFPVIFCTAN